MIIEILEASLEPQTFAKFVDKFVPNYLLKQTKDNQGYWCSYCDTSYETYWARNHHQLRNHLGCPKFKNSWAYCCCICDDYTCKDCYPSIGVYR